MCDDMVNERVRLLTCKHQPHENILQEGVVDDVPEPVEVGENVMHNIWTGL